MTVLVCYDCGYVRRVPLLRLWAWRQAVAEHGVRCLVRLREMARTVPTLAANS